MTVPFFFDNLLKVNVQIAALVQIAGDFILTPGRYIISDQGRDFEANDSSFIVVFSRCKT